MYPILFLQMSTYSQFMFGTDAIRQAVSFPRAEISKAPTMYETTKSNPSDAQEKAEGWKMSEVCTWRENTMLPCIAE